MPAAGSAFQSRGHEEAAKGFRGINAIVTEYAFVGHWNTGPESGVPVIWLKG